ncbi:MAG TPA: dTMP kinase [Patescibacteria group bacterium]|nr:dTMP kinase [Patescibacteria group bacterium]
MKYPVSFEIELKKHDLPGKFIVFEGNEGSGKTTHALDLVKKLEAEGVKVIYTKEPTGGEIGQLIRRVLSGEVKSNPAALQYLFGADRSMHQEEIVELLKQGYVVISDRYFWSAAAYGLSDLGNVLDYYLTIYSILSFYNQFLSPDITFFLDVNLDVAVERISKSHKHSEIYDNREHMEKVKIGYDELIKKFPDEFTIIDANRDLPQVSADLMEKVKEKLK